MSDSLNGFKETEIGPHPSPGGCAATPSPLPKLALSEVEGLGEERGAGGEERAFKETELGPLPVEWEVVRLRELAQEFFSGGTPSTKRPEFWDGDIPWTTSAYIDGLYLERGAKYITSQGLKRSASKVVPRGNLMIGTRVGVGKVAITAIDVAISQDLTGAIVDKTRAHPEFLAYVIQSDGVQELIRLSSRGTTIKGIPRKDLVQIPIPLPPLPEQRRIAHVLSTIQRAIAAQDALIAAARELKRSLMRHLFTYGPVPLDQTDQVPLKETEIGPVPEHWEVVRLGMVASLIMGQSPPSSTYNTDGEGLPFLQGKAEFGDIYPTPIKWCSQPKKVADPGSVLISVRAPVGDVNVAKDEYCIGRGLAAISGGESLDNWFVFYWLIFAKQRLEDMGTGSTFKSINRGVLEGFPIPLPPVPEQHRIASILQATDRKIEAEEQRKAALQALFRTMLQQLMTGQVRV